MQDFAWDPLKDEIFMTQNIRTANGRATIRINSRVVDVENNTVRLARRAHSPHQGEGYGDGLEGSLRDAGLRKPSVIDTSDGCAAHLKLVQDSGSLLRVLFWRNLPIGEQLIDSRKSLLHGLLWLGQTFDLSMRAELLPEPLHSRCYVVNVSGR
jgi:hypothetical protein